VRSGRFQLSIRTCLTADWRSYLPHVVIKQLGR
jgi:hypothetical protein